MRLGRRTGLVVCITIATLVLLELSLQALYFVNWVSSAQEPVASAAGAEGSDERVVLCLGDSFTAGMGGSSPEFSYPSQMQGLLSEQGGAWRVENRGWPGKNSREVLEQLDGLLVTVKPDYVCVVVGVNDTWAHPPEFMLPESLEGATVAGEPFVWRLRTLRFLSTFRALNPFREKDSVRQATGLAMVTGEDILGKWWMVDGGMMLELLEDGTGMLGEDPVTWRTENGIFQLSAAGVAAMVGRLALDDERLTVDVPNRVHKIALIRAPDDATGLERGSIVRQGYQAIAAKDYGTAKQIFESFVPVDGEERSGQMHLVSALCRIHAALGDTAMAEGFLDRLRRCNERLSSQQSAEALVAGLMALGRDAEVVALAEKGAVEYPESCAIWITLARMRYNAGDTPGAITAIDNAIRLNTGPPRSHAYSWRLKGTIMKDDPADADIFRECVARSYLCDGDEKKTRQILGMGKKHTWTDEQVTALCARLGATEEQKKVLLGLREQLEGNSAEDAIRVLRSHMRQLVLRCRSVGAQPMLGSYPWRNAHDKAAQSVTSELGLPWVATHELFTAARRENPGRKLTVSDGHCNDAGYALMAKAFATAINEVEASKSRGQ